MIDSRGRDLQDAWLRAAIHLKPAIVEMGNAMKKAAAALKGFTFTVTRERELQPGDLVRTIECEHADRIVSWNYWAIPAGTVGKFECYDEKGQPVIRFGDMLFNTTAVVKLGVNAEVVDIVTAIGSLDGRA